MTIGPFERRDFLKSLAATAVLPAAAFAAGLSNAHGAIFDSPGVMATIVIGREVLRQGIVPADAEPLFAGFGRAPLSDPIVVYRQLAPSIPSRAAKDFQSGETARVSGWVFSQSEVRFCALLALTADRAGAGA